MIRIVYFLVIIASMASSLTYINSHIQQMYSSFEMVNADYEFDAQRAHTHWRNLIRQIKNKDISSKTYSVVVGGDIMLDRGVEARVLSNGGDYDFIFNNIREDLVSADLVFANLEGSSSDIGTDTNKKYSFRFDPISLDAIKDAGIDILSLANNHMLDWGRDSLCSTVENLKEKEIGFAGAGCDASEAERPYIVELEENSRIAFLAYTEFYQGAQATDSRAGMTHYDLEKITERINVIKENDEADLVFVSIHWGEEYEPRSNSIQQSWAHAVIDAGADVIIGHHPHVPQEIERYGDGWIIYSLGNFVFDQSWSEETMKGLLADIQVQGGEVKDIRPVPIQLNENFQPEIAL